MIAIIYFYEKMLQEYIYISKTNKQIRKKDWMNDEWKPLKAYLRSHE